MRRNSLCECGSGRKFKHCCRSVMQPATPREIRLASAAGFQSTPEMLEARKIGIKNLYDQGLPAALLWGYMRTGQIMDEARGGSFSPVMRGQWSMAMEEFKQLLGVSADREAVLQECAARLTSGL